MAQIDLAPPTSMQPPFNVCIIRWPGEVPYFEAYREVAETVKYGLEKMGYEALLSDNKIIPGRTNIVFGFHIITPPSLDNLPRGTILYQMEQILPDPHALLRPVYYAIQSRFPVWDFSSRNCDVLRRLGITNVVHVPLGYVPEMSRIETAAHPDVDILFYGSIKERRSRVLQGLTNAGLRVKVLRGIYGRERDAWIARSKVVLNMHLQPARIFEIVRVAYLLANAKAVVSEWSEETEIDPCFREAVALADYEALVEKCIDLVGNEERRRALEQRGYSIMSARDECAYLRAALTATCHLGLFPC